MVDVRASDPVDAFLTFHASTISATSESTGENPPQSSSGDTSSDRLLYELRAKLNLYHYITSQDKDAILLSLDKLSKIESTGSDFRVLKNIQVGKACDWIETTNDVLGMAKFTEGTEVIEDPVTSRKMLGFINKLNISSEIQYQRTQKLISRFGYEDPSPPVPPEEEKIKMLTINPHSEIDIYREHPIYCVTKPSHLTSTIIWKGKIKNSGIDVAIKLYKSKDEQKVSKYKTEAEILQRLSGQQKVFLDYYGMFYEKVIEDNEEIHKLYLVMELCQGSLMDDISNHVLNRQYYLSDNSFYDIVRILLEGFCFLEQLKIYHLDIKPHNIFISKEGHLKIADFNISTFADAIDTTYMTTTSQILQGTEGYMAPEIQLAFDLSKKNPTAPKSVKYKRSKADVYSLGLTFLQLYCLQPVAEINKCTDQNYMNNYLDQFQPPCIANMLKGMLTVDYKQRFSFKRALATFMTLYAPSNPDLITQAL